MSKKTPGDKKKREQQVRAQKLLGEKQRNRLKQRQKLDGKLFSDIDEKNIRLQCEILLSTLGLELSQTNFAQARNFLRYSGSVGESFDTISGHIDSLFAFAHDKVPAKYRMFVEEFNADSAVRHLFTFIAKALKAFEKRVQPILSSSLGKKICETDNLLEKLDEICGQKRAEIIANETRLTNAYTEFEKRTINPSAEERVEKFKQELKEELPELSDDEFDELAGYKDAHDLSSDPEFSFQYRSDAIISVIQKPFEIIQNFQLGITTTFYFDIIYTVERLSLPLALFFLRKLYASMILNAEQNEVALVLPDNHTGLRRFAIGLNINPERVLPDPESFQNLRLEIERLNRLRERGNVVGCLEYLNGNGKSYPEALLMLERIAEVHDHQHLFTIFFEILTIEVELNRSIYDCCIQNPSFVRAYEMLRESQVNPKHAIQFLADYGDYKIGDVSFARIILNYSRRPEAVRILVDNALYFCCGEGAHDMLDLLGDISQGTRALRYFINFAKENSPYKQLAMLRYLKHRGFDNKALDVFVSRLKDLSDETVAMVILKGNFETILCLSSAVEIDSSEEKEKPKEQNHPLKQLVSFDLISRYGFAVEVAELPIDLLVCLNDILNKIRGSRFEALLLGQSDLRQEFLVQLKKNSQPITTALFNLPEDGNPYSNLRDVLFPSNVQQVIEEINIPEQFNVERIILVSSAINPQTVTYLAERFGTINVHEIDANASAAKFSSIRRGDLVVYDTAHTSHSAYYRAKNVAFRRGAKFFHASRMNHEALVEQILSQI